MRFGILGPLQVVDDDGRELPVGSRMLRAVLVILLLHRGEVVSSDRLADELWAGEPPATAAKSLQVHVSRLRSALAKGTGAKDRLGTVGGGYQLRVNEGELDAERFERLLEEAGALLSSGEAGKAMDAFTAALSLWRGAPLSDFEYDSFAQAESARLSELRMGAVEQRIEAALGLGREAQVIGELERVVRAHPFRERLRGQLMLALYRSGRQGEALQAYRDARAVLVEELGIEPSAELRQLQEAILAQDSSLVPLTPGRITRGDEGAPPGGCEPGEPAGDVDVAGACLPKVPAKRRKVVTTLFCGVTGSAPLGEEPDPEALAEVMSRVSRELRVVIERHGGIVDRAVGNAVMAVFGIPAAHEDDALRAVRAAVEVCDALARLGIRARIGVNTGEVVTATHEGLATGDAVNVAAQLEQAAQPNEILIGQPTLALVRSAVEVGAVEPLTLGSRSRPVPAYRLLSVREARERDHDTMFVGRRHELGLLRDAWERSRSEQRCELATVVGDAGVGKSRLAREFLAGLGGEVVSGRCLPYGEGITYWPVIEVLRQLPDLPSEPAAASAVTSLLGGTDAFASGDDIAWGFRKTLEHAAAAEPLVVVFDDIQWGEPAFLELIEHVALLSSGSPILLLCLARPELTELRPQWPVTLRLAPLDDDDVERLIGERVSEGLRAKIARAAGGNPLFIHEMLAMASEADGEVTVPPTLRALIAARLDRLDGAERGVLERGAVEGELFHRGAVQALDGNGQVTSRLAALVRKGLIRPDRPELPGEDAFRFRHLLIRDAAYASLPKAVRAELHERTATWLDEHGPELVELDELAGYHLEQACRYQAELGMPPDEHLWAAARRRLREAGRRAVARHDFVAAATLLERATALLVDDQLDRGLEIEQAEAAWAAGRGADAVRRAHSIADRGARSSDRIAELCGRILSCKYRSSREPGGAMEQLEQVVGEALPVFEDSGDDVALFIGYSALGQIANSLCKGDDAARAFDRAAVHAGRAGTSDESSLFSWRAMFRLLGSVAVPEFLAWLDDQESSGVQALTLNRFRGDALARLGRFEEARALLAEHLAGLRDRGNRSDLASCLGFRAIEVELLAGDPAAAIGYGKEGCAILKELGYQAELSTAAAYLALALCEAECFQEAEAWAHQAAELGAPDDVATQALWRQAMARVLAVRGEHSEAERAAREAVEIADSTDYPEKQADAYVDLADVLWLAGHPREAAEALREALVRYERKGVLVMTIRVRERLEALQQAAGQ